MTATPNPAHLDAVRRMVAQAPYPSHMRMTLDALDVDTCEVRIALERCHLQPYGIVHGGVIATAIDTATFWAAYVRLPADCGMVNVDLKLNYLSAIASGTLVTEGRCVRPGRTISYSEAWVRDDSGKLIAHGTSTLMALPGKPLAIDEPKFLG